MSLWRRNPKRDTAEPIVIAAFVANGARAWKLSIPRFPDLLIGDRRSRRFALVEVKTGTRARKDQEAQATAIRELQTSGWPVFYARNPDDVAACLRELRDQP